MFVYTHMYTCVCTIIYTKTHTTKSKGQPEIQIVGKYRKEE